MPRGPSGTALPLHSSKGFAVAGQTPPGPRQESLASPAGPEMPSAVAHRWSRQGAGKAGLSCCSLAKQEGRGKLLPRSLPASAALRLRSRIQGRRGGDGRLPHLEPAGGPLGGGVGGPHQVALLQPLQQRLAQVVLEPDGVHAGVVVADVALDGGGGRAFPLVQRPDGLGDHGQRGRVAALGEAGCPRGLCGGREREPAGLRRGAASSSHGARRGGRPPLGQQPLIRHLRRRPSRPTFSAGGAAPGPALCGRRRRRRRKAAADRLPASGRLAGRKAAGGGPGAANKRPASLRGEAFGPGTCKEASSRATPPAPPRQWRRQGRACGGTQARVGARALSLWEWGGAFPAGPAFSALFSRRASSLGPSPPGPSLPCLGTPFSPRSPPRRDGRPSRGPPQEEVDVSRGGNPGEAGELVRPPWGAASLFLFNSEAQRDPRSCPLRAFPAEDQFPFPRGL
ncbi:hypothetical protein E2320_022241 [Naja naja]|nr:hypothetical protein E2320_022241 [Naja naja]